MIREIYGLYYGTNMVTKCLKGENVMEKMPKIEELAELIECGRESILLQEHLREIMILEGDSEAVNILNKRIFLSKQLFIQLELANETIKQLNHTGTE